MSYPPLVITANTAPEVAPVPITFTTNNHVVGIWIGSNSNTLALTNPLGIANGNCIFGSTIGGAVNAFGQFAHCNAAAFWRAVEVVRSQGLLPVPPIGLAADGLPCPTIRDYSVVDMDPDDGVPTQYLITANGNVIQKTLNNMKLNIQGELNNDGDHHLVSAFVQAASGCNGWLVPDAADPGVKRAAIPMNVLQATSFQGMPVEALPATDPMTTVNNNADITKHNLYRKGIYQPQINNLIEADPAVFCKFYGNLTFNRMKSLSAQLKNTVSPAGPGMNLFDFMKARASTTYGMLNCANLIGLPDPFVNLMKLSNNEPLNFRPKVASDVIDWEEYKNGGYDDQTVYRSYRYGKYYQPYSKYGVQK